jgi:hypothetical protein
MPNFGKDHAALAARHPIPNTLVYGYEVVTRRRDPATTYIAVLYAVTVDGRVFARRTSSDIAFHQNGACWEFVRGLPEHAAYVGTYDASPIAGQPKDQNHGN